MKTWLKRLFGFLAIFAAWSNFPIASADSSGGGGHVIVLNMDMMILPGTAGYLDDGIALAEQQGAKLLIVQLHTPGGILDTTQRMIQSIFRSKVPVVIYVAPSGSTAASAGVFITLAGHIAAMAPGTSIGAAHPVAGDGKNIEGDMRAKAENMTIAMVKSIAERRGRNVAWAEKAVKESSSITEKEALKQGVIDLVADDLDDLLRQIKGKEVQVESQPVVLGDYSGLEKRYVDISYQNELLNVLSNPNIAALLWLAATTGISIELYNPGAILPGVVGVICLILALAVSQIIPISQGAVMLLVVGALLIGAELYTGSLILGVGGVISMVLGAIYLVDVSQAPGLSVAFEMVVPLAAFLGLFMLYVATQAVRVMKKAPTTGASGLIGQRGKAVENVAASGRVFLNGEYWNAVSNEGIIEAGAAIEVAGIREGLVLEVRKIV